jgi:hypothetical protein
VRCTSSITRKNTAADAPIGHENCLRVMVNVPHDQGQDWRCYGQNASEW